MCVCVPGRLQTWEIIADVGDVGLPMNLAHHSTPSLQLAAIQTLGSMIRAVQGQANGEHGMARRA